MEEAGHTSVFHARMLHDYLRHVVPVRVEVYHRPSMQRTQAHQSHAHAPPALLARRSQGCRTANHDRTLQRVHPKQVC